MHSLTEIKYYGMTEIMRHLNLKVVHSSGAGQHIKEQLAKA